ncbi:phage tail protein [Nocardia sp. CA-290969]|uniref:phage tail protein n=1 Tax=Nocardia sp. CA-290969 TaxID=3239986 RepID=UPI003D9105B1
MANVELATAYVSILPETSRIAPRIREAIADADGERVRVEVDVDDSGLRNLSGSARAANAELGGMGSSAGSLAKLAGVLGAVGGAGGLATGAVGTLGIGMASLGPAAIAVGATVAVGFQGMGDAISAVAEGDMEALNEAMGKLAPSAQAMVTAIGGQKAAWDELQGAVQQEMFAGLDQSFTNLANTTMPTLREGMTGVAGSLNQAAAGAMSFFATAEAQAGIQAAFSSASTLISAIAPGLGQATQGFLSMAQAAAPAMQSVGAGLGGLLGSIGQAFTNTFASGALTQLIDGFGQTLAGLGQGLQPLIEGLIGAAAQIAPVLGPLFASIGQAIGPVLPMIGQMGAVLGGALTQAIQALAPALGPVVSAISSMLSAVAPLLPVIAEVASGLLQALAPALTVLFDAIGPVIKQVTDLMMPIFRQLQPILQQVAMQLGTALADAITQLAPILPPIIEVFAQLVTAIAPLLPQIVQLITSLLPPLVSIITAVAPLLTKVATIIITLATQAIEHILMPALRFLAGVFQSTFELAANVVQVAVDLISGTIDVALGIFDALKTAIGAVGDAFGAAKDWIVEQWNNLIDWFKELPGKVTSAVSGLWDGIKNAFRDAINWLINAWNNFRLHFEFTIPVIDKDISLTVDTPDLPLLARGGRVSGPGTGTSDSIIAGLSNGEFVVNARSTAANLPLLEAINAGWVPSADFLHGLIPGFASGGIAGGAGSLSNIQQGMWEALRNAFPEALLTSATRTVDVGSGYDFHMQGKAIDIAGPNMGEMAEWIATNFPGSLELIHGNGFGNNIDDGKNVGDGMSYFGADTMAGHNDHVHWAMNTAPNVGAVEPGSGALSSGGNSGGGSGGGGGASGGSAGSGGAGGSSGGGSGTAVDVFVTNWPSSGIAAAAQPGTSASTTSGTTSAQSSTTTTASSTAAPAEGQQHPLTGLPLSGDLFNGPAPWFMAGTPEQALTNLNAQAGALAQRGIGEVQSFFQDNWKEMIETGAGVLGMGAMGGGTTFNISGTDPMGAAAAVERVHRRRTLATQRSGGLGR